MAWLSNEKKEKIIKTTNKKYIARRVFLFMSTAILSLILAFVIFSFIMTMVKYANFHNQGLSSGEVWIKISHNWWSTIKVVNEQTYHEGDKAIITFSLLSYILMGVGGAGLIMLIVSIILIAVAKSPNKIEPLVNELDDDYWKKQISKINNEHAVEIDAWQEYLELQKLRSTEKKESLEKKHSKKVKDKETKKN